MAEQPRQKTEDRIRIEPARRAVSVAYHDAVVAASTDALILRENGYDPVFYIPKSDVRMDLLEPTDRHTTCPWKGEARYWSVKADGATAENAVWAYDSRSRASRPSPTMSLSTLRRSRSRPLPATRPDVPALPANRGAPRIGSP